VAGGSAQPTADSRFGFYGFRFPIARCGTALRAARGGRVSHNETHSAAGNYLVIDGKGTELDFMYAHLSRRSPLREGARVRTGQMIGRVGDTGNASGCHLHFEAWSAPGWYEGGSALPSVRRMLKTWDAWS
jgi:murein DD-endopeptidase MepM/ murein hydrolase activator NlpD